jgi:hypothetical protein
MPPVRQLLPPIVEAIDDKTYLRVIHEDRDGVLLAKTLLQPDPGLAELVKNCQACLTDWNDRQTQLGSLLERAQQLASMPAPKPVLVHAEIPQDLRVARTMEPTESGLLRVEDFLRHLSAQGFIRQEEVFPQNSVVFGKRAGHYAGRVGRSVILGADAGVGFIKECKDVVVIGANAQPLSDRSASIGDTRTQTHTVLSTAIRSDARDVKADPLDLGLTFLLRLSPKRVQLDLREDYIDWTSFPEPPARMEAPPVRPAVLPGHGDFDRLWAVYRQELAPWVEKQKLHAAALADWRQRYDAWLAKNDPSNIVPDGTRQRKESQPMILADDLLQAALSLGAKAPGVVDPKAQGGLDIKTSRPEDLIPVLVQGIQDLHAMLISEPYIARIAHRMLALQQAHRQRHRAGSEGT